MKIIHTYTRRQAVEDGFQIDVSETAREAGITFPVFLTSGVWARCVTIPEGVTCQDESGRLWDVVWMLRVAIMKSTDGTDRIPVSLFVRNSDAAPARLVRLTALCVPRDIDDPSPTITVMLPDED